MVKKETKAKIAAKASAVSAAPAGPTKKMPAKGTAAKKVPVKKVKREKPIVWWKKK